MSRKNGHVWTHKGGPMCVGRDDGRYAEYREEQKKTGVSPDETWNLDVTIAEFVLPRLKLFKEKTIGVPCCFGTMEEWHAELDRMIRAFELMCDDKAFGSESQNEIDAGLDSFRKYFQALWW